MSVSTRPGTGSFPTRRRILGEGMTRHSRPLASGPSPRRTARRMTGAIRAVEIPAPPVELVVLVPAYRPDMRLARLVADLGRRLPGCQVLVVDDGSGAAFEEVFAAARAAGSWPQADVVCADADGQHTPADIAAVAARVRSTGRMTLGVRMFTGQVPLRSRIGNDVTALLFRGATGWRLRDTQTGLRGYPAGCLDWLLTVPGNRYEYELSTLLRAHELGLGVEEVEIETIYELGNTSSHFRPLVDSARIYAPLLRFVGASLASFAIDWLAVMVLFALTGNLLASVVGARLTSGTCNFFLNRRVFHAAPGTVGRTALRYVTLALTLLAASYVALWTLTGLGVPLGVAKIIGDGSIYVASYLAQRRVVFR
ncbi:GtrA family protein [Actinomyces howellii]|uniref:GtrA-like protein n=1 Tax=Actinomyces howellii TaxID=52771 RepID=A0A3S4UYN5_9ACTO|nr:GtrA family protein [Actinomyces howellii]VEG29367.1 GtrA-like protein [Actinomyces howellii]